jgi:hypothetical protein
MKNLFEVVFEGVNKNYVVRILNRLISSAKHIIDVDCSEDIVMIRNGIIDMEALQSVLNFNGSVSIFIKLQSVEAGNVILPFVLLRLVKYGDQFDVDFNFNSDEISNMDVASLMKYMHRYATDVARESEVKHFFGGMEPASDKGTRYFTDQIYGPLS